MSTTGSFLHKSLKFIILAVMLPVVVYVIMSFVWQSNTLSYEITYQMPDLPDLNNLYTLGYGDYAVAIDGTVVAENTLENHKAQPTASTAKMILGLAVMKLKPFELGEKGETLVIDREDYDSYLWYYRNGGSTTAVTVGEEISEYDALASVFLPSSNNMADTLAKWAFGSLDNYRESATQMLHEWGVNNTTIGDDASGFSNTTTSTASDLAIIGHKVLSDPVLSQIVGMTRYEVPVADVIENTNSLIGVNGIAGVKTGYIGSDSGYCLVSGYYHGKHIITIALLGAPSRQASFDDTLAIVDVLNNKLKDIKIVDKNQEIGYYNSWWTGKVPILAQEELTDLAWKSDDEYRYILEMNERTGTLKIKSDRQEFSVSVRADEYEAQPSFFEKLKHIFGWQKDTSNR